MAFTIIGGGTGSGGGGGTGAWADITGKPPMPSGNIVGDTDTQTLTNKTLTAPAIADPTGIDYGDLGGVPAAPSMTNIGGVAAGYAARTEGQLLTVDADLNVVPANPDLTVIADVSAIVGVNGDFMVKVAGSWVPRTAAQARADLGVAAEGIPLPFSAPANGTYTVVRYMAYAYTITGLINYISSGTINVTITIDGVNVTGLVTTAASSTESSHTATAANTGAAGTTIRIVFASGSSPGEYDGTLLITR